jgi:hypothetical protein
MRTATLLPASLLLLAAALPAADIAYREIFPTGPNAAANGWRLNHSVQAWVGDKDQCWGAAPGVGATKAVNSLSADEDDLDGWKGFVWLNANSPAYLLWTSECAFKDGSVERLAWRFTAKDPASTVRVALRIGTAWYASAQTVSDAAGGDIKNAKEYTLEVTKTTWIPFTWQANSKLPGALEGTGAALPAGSVTAFGFLGAGRTQTHVYDTIEVFTTTGSADAIRATK